MDFIFSDQGTIVLVEAVSETAKAWLAEHVAWEPWQEIAGAIAVDHRPAQDLFHGIVEEGFGVEFN